MHMKLNLLAARILCALLAAFISLSASAYDFEADGIYYNITSTTDKTVSVTYKNDGVDNNYNDADTYSGEISIPFSVNYKETTYYVTAISDYAFSDCTSLTNISIHSEITEVGAYAFNGCSNLTACNIMSQLQEIKPGTFDGCSSMRGMILPDRLQTIGISAFAGCSSLITIGIPNNVSTIGTSAFENCKSLISVQLPENISQLDTRTFYGCIYNHRTTKTNQKYPSVNL